MQALCDVYHTVQTTKALWEENIVYEEKICEIFVSFFFTFNTKRNATNTKSINAKNIHFCYRLCRPRVDVPNLFCTFIIENREKLTAK